MRVCAHYNASVDGTAFAWRRVPVAQSMEGRNKWEVDVEMYFRFEMWLPRSTPQTPISKLGV